MASGGEKQAGAEKRDSDQTLPSYTHLARHPTLARVWPYRSLSSTRDNQPQREQKREQKKEHGANHHQSGTDRTAKDKAEMAERDMQVFRPRDLVLAKVKGFPPWPAMVMDPKHAPPNIRDAQPVGWRRHTPYAVRFFPRGDYTWIANNYIVPLTSEGIAEYQAASADPTRKRRSGTGLGRVDLGYAYEAASRPEAWEKELEQTLKDARKEAEKKKKASKVGVDVDELKVGQKRKRAKPKAKFKSKAAAKATKPKLEEEEEMMFPDVAVLEEEEEEAGPSKKKPRKEAGKKGTSKAVGRKAKELLEADPVALEIKEWRNKLQKTFLKQSGLPPKDTEMPDMDDLFTEIEEYDEMSVEYLAFSKINKVMRHVHLLEPERVPRDAEFRFRDRAKVLVDRWTEMLNEDKGEGEGGEADLTMME
uniref:PWWP domain-containing protein n=1 Tax=Mycena chlorophos TaxID=658473 RepID=A0ABQ0LWW1_MYCCL|nr:predicted protein [Mycena chlorophos]